MKLTTNSVPNFNLMIKHFKHNGKELKTKPWLWAMQGLPAAVSTCIAALQLFVLDPYRPKKWGIKDPGGNLNRVYPGIAEKDELQARDE